MANATEPPDGPGDDQEYTVSSLDADRAPGLPPEAARANARLLRFSLATLSGALVIALVLLALLPRAGPTSIAARATPTPTIAFGAGSGACLSDAQWSPDSAQVALLVAVSACDINQSDRNDQIWLLTPNGQVTTRISIDHPIQVADQVFAAEATPTPIPTPPAGPASMTIIPRSIRWLGTGQLVVVFNVITLFENGKFGGPSGLLFINPDGTNAHVVIHNLPDAAYAQGTAIIWDLATGAAQVQSLPPAESYHWQGSDTLAADNLLGTAPLAPAPAPGFAGPPGATDGAAFSIWQPGIMQSPLAGVDVWGSYFTALAPDGRTLETDLGIEALLLPGPTIPSASDLATTFAAGLPRVGVRDACLASVLAANEGPNDVNSPPAVMQLAWRPDGRYLAVAPGNLANILIYDCRTGADVQTITPQGVAPAGMFTGSALVWSPDGGLLFAVNPGQSATVVFTALSLPA